VGTGFAKKDMRKRIAFWLGVVVLGALWGLAGAAVITARPADPMLWPPRPDAATIEIAVTSNGYHSGVALPRTVLAEFASGRGYPALIAVTQRFAAYDWIEFGWGDAEFYRLTPGLGDISPRIALRALFSPGNPSVLHVVGITGDPARAFLSADIVRVPLSRNGFDQLLARLDASFVPPRGGALPDLGGGLYGPSLFYQAHGSFNLFRVCNHWTGELLAAAGLPTTPVLETAPAGLMLSLRWRAGLRPVPRGQ
jgi:uncharacterized protein (TIGR02117 family)